MGSNIFRSQFARLLLNSYVYQLGQKGNGIDQSAVYCIGQW